MKFHVRGSTIVNQSWTWEGTEIQICWICCWKYRLLFVCLVKYCNLLSDLKLGRKFSPNPIMEIEPFIQDHVWAFLNQHNTLNVESTSGISDERKQINGWQLFVGILTFEWPLAALDMMHVTSGSCEEPSCGPLSVQDLPAKCWTELFGVNCTCVFTLSCVRRRCSVLVWVMSAVFQNAARSMKRAFKK